MAVVAFQKKEEGQKLVGVEEEETLIIAGLESAVVFVFLGNNGSHAVHLRDKNVDQSWGKQLKRLRDALLAN